MTLLLVLLSLTWNLDDAPPGVSGQARQVPLFDLRAELAADDRPYLHLTPEGVLIYFRTTLLKTLPVVRLETADRHPLRISRVESWAPELRFPVVVLNEIPGEEVAAVVEERLRLDDAPSAFTVLLEDGTAVLVTAAASDRSALRALQEMGGPGHKQPVLFLQLRDEDDCRQLHWHLQEEMGVIY